MLDYLRLPEEQQILREIGWWRVVTTTAQALPKVVCIAWSARELKKRWPWVVPERYLDTKVGTLRREFGIPRSSCA